MLNKVCMITLQFLIIEWKITLLLLIDLQKNKVPSEFSEEIQLPCLHTWLVAVFSYCNF